MPERPGSPDEGHTRRTTTPDSTLVAGYEDFVEVGRGGFGIVYRALQIEFNRTVAVKVLTGVFDASARGRFERECLALGSLSDHPNIVTVFAAGFTDDRRPYLAMEFLPGGSLGERLAGRPMPWDETVAVGVKIAGALQRAHDTGVLHRDVKPDNILISAYGEPKLADFGIARLQGGYETRTGVITATFAHAAPELLEGKPPTPVSDVYSLASTLYALISGRAPFVTDAEDSLPAVIARIATQPPPDLRTDGVPDLVCLALERALAKDPARRTASAEALGAELQAAARAAGLRPPDLVVSPGGAPPREPGGRKPPVLARAVAAGRRRRVVLGAGLVVVALVAGIAVAVSSGGSSRRTTPASTIVPAMPSQLAGYRKDGPATTGTQRIFTDAPNYVDNFPWTMNGCSDAMNTTRWRSLVPDDVVAAGHTDVHGSTTLQVKDVKGVTTGRAGLITSDACQEPVFFLVRSTAGDTLVDVAVTTQHWTAAP